MIIEKVNKLLLANPKLRGMEDVIEKELLHQDILYVMLSEGFLKDLAFMGGTALRLCYGNNRLSEDLDFAGGFNFEKETFNTLAPKIEHYLQSRYQLPVEVREPKVDNSDTSTWKMTIVKHPKDKSRPAQKLHIDICKYPAIDKQLKPVSDPYQSGSFMTGIPIAVESMEEILSDKLIAFAFREQRIKPRDVWDIVWLTQQHTKLNAGFVAQKLAFRNKDTDHFLNLIEKHATQVESDMDTKQDFYQEMSRFLPPDVKQRTLDTDSFWQYIGQEVRAHVTSAHREMKHDIMKSNDMNRNFTM
jgi:predicted nucleotidyltransferase component of viral defense system